MRNAFDTMTRDELLVVVLQQDKLLHHMKYCSGCGNYKELNKFSNNRMTADGLQGRCKGCDAAYGAKWRRENAEYLKQAKEARKLVRKEHKK